MDLPAGSGTGAVWVLGESDRLMRFSEGIAVPALCVFVSLCLFMMCV